MSLVGYRRVALHGAAAGAAGALVFSAIGFAMLYVAGALRPRWVDPLAP